VTDALATLLRLRRLAADQARRDLAVSLAAEQRAAQASADAAADIERQADAAPRGADHPLAGAFSAWLPAGRETARAASHALNAATDAVSTCRDTLAHARAAERAVEHIQQDRKTAARVVAQRKQQAALDDT
jgi:flagellar biosynthesis chaperone FliJ